MPIGPIARRTPAARLSAATRCEGRRFRLPTSHRRSGRPDLERFKSIPRTSAAFCGHTRSHLAAILPPRPGQRRRVPLRTPICQVPGRWLYRELDLPQNISIASDVLDRAAFGDLLDIHRGASATHRPHRLAPIGLRSNRKIVGRSCRFRTDSRSVPRTG